VVITAYATRAGWTSAATRYREKAVKGKKRSGERGATQEHATLAAAKAAVEKLATAFVKNGWTRPERRAFGFARKPDAFGPGNVPNPRRRSRRGAAGHAARGVTRTPGPKPGKGGCDQRESRSAEGPWRGTGVLL
jgi:hypothetical protein